MRSFRHSLCVAQLLLLLLPPAVTRAATTQPATQPTTRPAPIDQVVNFPPINLKTKGLMPEEAFKLLSQATGIRISPAQQISSPGVGVSKKIDLWGDRPYSKIDFDLESVSFWQAVDRLAAQAKLQVEDDDGWMRLYPDSGTAMGWADANPVFHFRSDDELFRVRLTVELDPRVRICAVSPPVLEAADPDVPAHALTDCQLTPTGMSSEIGIDRRQQLTSLRGYVPVTVVTKSKEVELPLTVGAKVVAGPWTVQVVGFRKIGGNIGMTTRIDVSVEPNDKTSRAVPANLDSVVQLCDPFGVPLSLKQPPGPPMTAAGGIRQQFTYWDDYPDQTVALPWKIVITAPVESKDAILPFEFKDVGVP